MHTAPIRAGFRAPRLARWLLVCLFATLAAPVMASPEEIQNLIRQGKLQPALDQADRELASNPKDRKLRFLKGVALAELNRLDEAAGIFVKLTEEAPELPEPYNNLAVIYAQQKQYDKARAALEMAIRTHPAYSIAHENLGDLYAKMARQAYDRALQLDANNPNTQQKLSMIREIISVGTKPEASPPVKPVSTPAVVAAASVPAPAAKPASAPSTPSSPAAKPASAPVAASAAPAKPASSGEAEASAAVRAWAEAWSRKDVSAYLAAYAKSFEVPGKQSRAAWEAERRERVGKPGAIQVTLANLQVSVAGDRATARFRQQYRSSGLNSSSNKTLELVRQDGRWLIQQERLGK